MVENFLPAAEFPAGETNSTISPPRWEVYPQCIHRILLLSKSAKTNLLQQLAANIIQPKLLITSIPCEIKNTPHPNLSRARKRVTRILIKIENMHITYTNNSPTHVVRSISKVWRKRNLITHFAPRTLFLSQSKLWLLVRQELKLIPTLDGEQNKQIFLLSEIQIIILFGKREHPYFWRASLGQSGRQLSDSGISIYIHTSWRECANWADKQDNAPRLLTAFTLNSQLSLPLFPCSAR